MSNINELVKMFYSNADRQRPVNINTSNDGINVYYSSRSHNNNGFIRVEHSNVASGVVFRLDLHQQTSNTRPLDK